MHVYKYYHMAYHTYANVALLSPAYMLARQNTGIFWKFLVSMIFAYKFQTITTQMSYSNCKTLKVKATVQ